MPERVVISEAEARLECARCGIEPDDWRHIYGLTRVYAWQEVQAEMQRRADKEPTQ